MDTKDSMDENLINESREIRIRKDNKDHIDEILINESREIRIMLEIMSKCLMHRNETDKTKRLNYYKCAQALRIQGESANVELDDELKT